MPLIFGAPYIPQHANRHVRTKTGAGTGYVGKRRKQGPEWFLSLLDGVMEANRFQDASGSFTGIGRR